jgi:hypothetical protein
VFTSVDGEVVGAVKLLFDGGWFFLVAPCLSVSGARLVFMGYHCK